MCGKLEGQVVDVPVEVCCLLQFARLHLEAFKRQMLAGKDAAFCT